MKLKTNNREKSTKSKVGFLKKLNKIDILSARLTKKKKKCKRSIPGNKKETSLQILQTLKG